LRVTTGPKIILLDKEVDLQEYNPFVAPPFGGKARFNFQLRANRPASAERRYYELYGG
jgi:hypothetical protein